MGLVARVEWVGLIVGVAEQLCLIGRGRHPGWSDWWRGGRDAEVVQNPGHCGGRSDQGEQNHLRLAAGTFKPSDPRLREGRHRGFFSASSPRAVFGV